MDDYVYEIKELSDTKLSMIKHISTDPALDSLMKFKYLGSENFYYATKEFIESRKAETEYIT